MQSPAQLFLGSAGGADEGEGLAILAPGSGQHLTLASPWQRPVNVFWPRQVCESMSMQTPLHPDDCGVRVGVGVGAATRRVWPVGQHLLSTPPGQRPLRTAAPKQVNLPTSMHDPPLCAPSQVGGRVFLAGSCGAATEPDLRGMALPEGQHLMCAGPGQSPVLLSVCRHACFSVSRQRPEA